MKDEYHKGCMLQWLEQLGYYETYNGKVLHKNGNQPARTIEQAYEYEMGIFK